MMRVVLAVWCLWWTLVPNGWSQPSPPPIQWQRTYGGTLNDILHTLLQTSDGGYILGGRSIALPGGTKTTPSYGNYDYWLVRLDATGQQLWDRSFGGSMYDALRSMCQTADGGFLLAGYTESPPNGNKTAPYIGPRSFWVVRTDANGEKLWEQTYGGTGGETLAVMRQTPDGGFILGGTSNSSTSGNKTAPNYGWNSRDFWIMRIDAQGGILWDRAFGSVSDDDLHSLELTPDGGFILGGMSPVGASGNKTSDNYGGPDYWIIRVDSNGNKIWEQTYGGWGTDDLYAVVPASDGGFLLGGYSDSPPSGVKTATTYGGTDLWVVKVDANGHQLWDRSFGGDAHDNFMDTFNMHRTRDGGYIIGTGTGGASFNGNKNAINYGGSDMWVVRLDAAGNKLWDQSYGASDTDVVNTLQETADGGFIFGGQSYSDVGGNKTAPRQGGADYWVVKIGSDTPGSNMPPTISANTDRTMIQNSGPELVEFTVQDTETAAANLQVTVAVSNPTLFAPEGLVLEGTGSARTLRLTPVAGQLGSARVTLTVVDAGGARGSNSFQVEVVSGQTTPPTVSGFSDQVMDEDQISGPIAFAVGDAETAAQNLVVSGRSSNLALVSNNRLTFGGSGANRTLTIAPLANQSGSAQISVIVADAHGGRATNTFLLTVQPINDSPTINQVPDQTLIKNGSSTPIPVSIGDVETPATSLTLTPSSSNPSLVPETGLVWEGAGTNRTLRITPATNQIGTSIITLTVDDGALNSSDSFVVTVQESVLTDLNLISHWKLDESSGTTVLDVTARNPGVLVTGPERVPGKLRGALRFNGLNNYVNIPDSDSLDLGAHLTIGFWFKPSQLLDAHADRKDLFKKFLSYWVVINYPVNDGKLTFILNSGAPVVSSTRTQWLPDQWYHVAATYDSATMRLYINGELENSMAASVTPAVNSFPVQFGGNSEQAVFFPGLMDDVCLYSIALSVAEVRELAASTAIPNSPPQISPLQDQTINEDSAAFDLPFTVSDQETPTTDLTVTATSSNPAVLAPAALILGGTGSARTLRLSPATNAFGQSTVTVTVQDADGSVFNESFLLTVQPVNDAPSLSAIGNQSIEQDLAGGPFEFVVGDVETAPGLLTLRGESSNQALVRDAGISFGGSGAQRNISVAPVAGRAGTTQITVWVSDGPAEQSVSFTLTVVASSRGGPGTPYITTTTPGAPRNDFTGFAGYKITVGSESIHVTALARYVYSGNNRPHVVKIVRAADGVDVPGASATITTAGAAAGQWRFVDLASPVALEAGASYYVVSEEQLGGDQFGDLNTIITTTNVAAHNSGVYATAPPNYVPVGGPPQAYGPPNFRYLRRSELPLPTVAYQEPTDGTKFTRPAQISLVVAVSADVTNVDFFSNGILLGRDTQSPAQFTWNNPPFGYHVLTAQATDNLGRMVVAAPVNITVRTNVEEQAFVLGQVLGELRNDITGFVGMKFTIGPQPLTILSLGRSVAPGNTGTHLVKLVRAADLADVPHGSVTINTAGQPTGIVYEPLSFSVTLAANTMYYLVSAEVSGGDRWHGVRATVLTTRTVAAVNSGVFMSSCGWALAGLSSHAYGPVDFTFEADGIPSPLVDNPSGGDGVAATPVAATLGAWRCEHEPLVNVRSQAGQHYVVEASNNLIDWVTVAEHTLERDVVTISDVTAYPSHFRFYRTLRH